MMKFTEAVKQYSEEKKARGLSSVVTTKELAKIRQLYKEGKFNENAEPENKEEKKEEMNESQRAMYEKTLKEFRDYKESKGLGRGVSTKQKRMIERTILCGTLTAPIALDENEKTIIAGPSAKVEEGLDKKAIVGSIREARKQLFNAKRLLKENDLMGAADATQAAGDAINAADAAIAPAAEGAVPQNIVDAVAAIKTSVDGLATQCGIESPVDTAADPNAGVPAVDGTMQDPNAGAAAPVMENTKLDAAKARLAKREAMLKKVKEGTDGQDAITQAINAMTNPQEFHDIDKKDSEELVKPTTKKSPEAANTWPTVKGSFKESKTEQMISERIAESENAWDFSRILREGILG
ncbi:MAG: hypothetical protein II304_14410 [Bacteroidales bacterium]|nr:hypothetical protein [Bacteroidales bacterium]